MLNTLLTSFLSKERSNMQNIQNDSGQMHEVAKNQWTTKKGL